MSTADETRSLADKLLRTDASLREGDDGRYVLDYRDEHGRPSEKRLEAREYEDAVGEACDFLGL